MRKRIVGFVAVIVLAVTTLGTAPASAEAEPNGKNCVGASASSAPKPGFGSIVSDIATSEPGAIASLVGNIRAAGC